jgi:hypothetical protein
LPLLGPIRRKLRSRALLEPVLDEEHVWFCMRAKKRWPVTSGGSRTLGETLVEWDREAKIQDSRSRESNTRATRHTVRGLERPSPVSDVGLLEPSQWPLRQASPWASLIVHHLVFLLQNLTLELGAKPPCEHVAENESF